jgi:hypothetical protein
VKVSFGNGGGTSPLVLLSIVIFIVGLAYFIFIKNPQLLNRLLGKGSGFVGITATVGETKPGPNIYPSLGDIQRSGAFGWNIANDGTSFRDNVSFPCDKCARETTWFFTPGTGGGGGSTGEDVTVKMGSHGEMRVIRLL